MESGGHPFYQRQVAEGIGSDPRYMGRELDVLCRLGMVRRLPPTPSDRRRFYEFTVGHPLWDTIDSLIDACFRMAQAGQLRIEPRYSSRPVDMGRPYRSDPGG